MNERCDVCRDLLPLYAEDLCSQGSRALVKKHLVGCPACRQALDAIRAAIPKAPDAALPLKMLSRKIKRSTLRVTAIVAAALLFVGTVVLYHATWRRYEPYQEGLASASVTEDGRLLIEANRPAGMEVMIYPTPAGEPTRVYVTFYNVRDGEGGAREYFPLPSIGTPAVYYAYPDEEAMLLLGPPGAETGFFLLPRLALNYWWMLAAKVAAALLALLIVFRKRPGPRRIAAMLLALPLSYLLAHFSVKGLQFTSWQMMRDFAFICAACGFAWTAALLALSGRRRSSPSQ